MSRDYYATLGVARSASAADIKAAFRAIAMENHPDKKPGDKSAEERFKEASEAYEVLSSPDKRGAYDRTGQHPTMNPSDFVNVAQAFKDLFTGWAPRAAHEVFTGATQDITVDIDLEFREAVLGCKKQISFGTGRSHEIKIPPGVENGTRLRLRGLGEGFAGDLYVNITVQPDSLFERSGLDLHTMALVTFPILVLGGTIHITTPAGPLDVTVKPGTAADDTLVLKKLGIQHPTGHLPHGDLHVHLRTVVPSKLTAEQRNLYTQLAALDSGAAIPLLKKRRKVW